MLDVSKRRITEQLADDELVLDVGGWAHPLERADWVIDLMPYETRGLYHYDRTAAIERFTAETWVQRDICDHEPWPFNDGQFDFAVCSHTLEDVRDPVRVCAELIRVAKAGYIEVPSRLEEQSWGVHGPWVGWSHHHWLVDTGPGWIQFVFKPHVIHARSSDHFPQGFAASLTPEAAVQTLWWEDPFEFGEQVFIESADLNAYLADFVREHAAEVEGRVQRRWPRRS